MMDELRSVKGLIEERFGALAFMEKLQRSPARRGLTQKLLDCRLLAGADPQAGRAACPPTCADESGLGRQRARAQPASPAKPSRRSKTRAACTR